MDRSQTLYWIDQLLPPAPEQTMHQIGPVLVRAAYDPPQQLSVAATVGFAACDQGLLAHLPEEHRGSASAENQGGITAAGTPTATGVRREPPASAGDLSAQAGGFSFADLIVSTKQQAAAGATPADQQHTPDAHHRLAGMLDVRCELVCVAAGSHPGLSQDGGQATPVVSHPEATHRDIDCLIRAVAAASMLIGQATPRLSAQPGQLLPGIGSAAGFHVDPTITVQHGLLIAPWLWAEGVPQVVEQPGAVDLFCLDNSAATSIDAMRDTQDPQLGRITVISQLLLLTDDEYNYGVTYGVAALQEALTEQRIAVMDLRR
ncbi:hypothetical protein ACFPVT_03740 [Corynebacterium choanae]|uniref:Suppressor of fused protein (SUFU) n=1 Tax=Corynebacterium choanae TaxID=1862358 RepID=A0A3G6J964_9CORY|nr:hypothetical protein [Corynebacterium choanae]AZA14607.1 hypothetical protein CCHOA_11150 [Corynebacterium choanae]